MNAPNKTHGPAVLIEAKRTIRRDRGNFNPAAQRRDNFGLAVLLVPYLSITRGLRACHLVIPQTAIRDCRSAPGQWAVLRQGCLGATPPQRGRIARCTLSLSHLCRWDQLGEALATRKLRCHRAQPVWPQDPRAGSRSTPNRGAPRKYVVACPTCGRLARFAGSSASLTLRRDAR